MPMYVFAGFPKSGLHAGGLRLATHLEDLCILEESKGIHYRKEGVFSGDSQGAEYLYPVEYHISAQCIREGISWKWFPVEWAFGNGITCHQTQANPEYKIVVHGTDLNLDEFLAHNGRTALADIELERIHIKHEGWAKYEARWRLGTCPQDSHIVRLVWLVTTHRLPRFVYERLQELIEHPNSQPEHLECYSNEPGKHFSAIWKWE